jgi:hypothetical protein
LSIPAEEGRRVAEKFAEIENILSEASAETRAKVTERGSGMATAEKFKEELEALEKQK